MKATKASENLKRKKEWERELATLKRKLNKIDEEMQDAATIEFSFVDVIGEVIDEEGEDGSEKIEILIKKREEVMGLLKDYLFRYCGEQGWQAVKDVIKEVLQ
jgi:hypothetical protein